MAQHTRQGGFAPPAPIDRAPPAAAPCFGWMMKQKTAARQPTNRLAGFILLCFFISGLTGLVYQIVWMRLLSRVIGGAPFAVAAILTVFMGGLGVGSYIAARHSDRFQGLQLVRVYGLLELTVGLCALLVPLLLMLSKGLYGLLYHHLYAAHTLWYNFFLFVGAALILGVPTICMGATLPVLCRFYVDRLATLGAHTGRLYGINTLGAAIGALLCGFWMLNVLGVWGTMWTAIALNCAIGLGCLALAPASATVPRAKAARPDRTPPPERPAPRTAAAPLAHPPVVVRGALILFMVSGFCAMAYEVLWTKLLGLIVGPTTYSFTIVLVTFIVGLALGNLVFGRLADRSRDAAALLVGSQIAAALCALGISQLIGDSQLFFAKLIHLFGDRFALLSLSKALVLFGFMVLPTFFLGATFPLVAKIYTRSLDRVGHSIGVAYTINTIGCVLGSFAAGFLLIPLVGKENGLRLVIGLQLLSSLTVGALLFYRQRKPLTRWAALAAALAAGTVLCIAYPDWNRHLLATGKYHRLDETPGVAETVEHTGWLRALLDGARRLGATEKGELIYYGDGIGGFTTVLAYPGPFGETERSMANSGKMDASSRGDMKTQTLLAHFPMLFARSPEKVMVLGLASGVTAGEVLHYPVTQLDVVDINDRVFEAGRLFASWNNNVLDDPRTRAIVQDAMAHLALTRTRYDVIISEPSNPWMAGMAALFTRDFFELARNRLTEGGIYVQWFHCYQMDWPTFAMIGRTFAQVFPNSVLVSCEPGGWSKDFLFVGIKGEDGLAWDRARENHRYARKSDQIALTDPVLLKRMLVAEDLGRLFGEGSINTDDRPLLEYAAPKLMHHGQAAQQALLRQLAHRAWLRPETRRVVRQLLQSVDARIDFAAYALSVHAPFPGMVDLDRADPDQRRRYEALLTDYCAANPMDFDLIGDPALVRRLQQVQVAAIGEKLPRMAHPAPAHAYLAWLLGEQGQTADAISHYRQALASDPDDAQTHNDIGFLLMETGELAAAVDHFESAIRLRPRFLLAMGNMAFALLAQERWDEALHYFRETLRVQPDIAESHYHAGRVLQRLGRWAEATDHLHQAVRLAPDMADAHELLARLLAEAPDNRLRDPLTAVGHARRASALTGDRDPFKLATLAYAYAVADRSDDAQQAAGQALAHAQATGDATLVAWIEGKLRSMGFALQ